MESLLKNFTAPVENKMEKISQHKILLFCKKDHIFGQISILPSSKDCIKIALFKNEILSVSGGEYEKKDGYLNIFNIKGTLIIKFINKHMRFKNYNNIHEEMVLSDRLFPKIVNEKIIYDLNFIIEKKFKYTVIADGEYIERKDMGSRFEVYHYRTRSLNFIIGTFNILEVLNNKYLHLPMFLFNNKTKELYKKYSSSVESLKTDLKKISKYLEKFTDLNEKFSFVLPLSIFTAESFYSLTLIPFEKLPVKNDLPQQFMFKEYLIAGFCEYIFHRMDCMDYHDMWLAVGLKEYFKLYLIRMFFGEDEFFYRRKKNENFILKNDVLELAIFDRKRPVQSYFTEFVRYKSAHILFILESNMSSVFMEKILVEYIRRGSTSTYLFITIINKIVGKLFKRIFYTLLLKPGAVLSNIMISLNASKNQVSVRISQKGTSLHLSGNKKLYGFLPISSIESDVEYEHMYDFFGNSDFGNLNNRKNENILRFNYHIRTKRLRGSVSNYLLATNQLKENNEISFLYLRVDEDRKMYSKYIVNNIKGGLKESIDDRSIYIQLDAIEGIIREINTDKNEDNSFYNHSLKVIELFDNLEQKLNNDNTFYKVKMEILRFFTEYDYQRVIAYNMKFINDKNNSTVIKPNNFHREDMRIFEYLAGAYMHVNWENGGVIVNNIISFLKYNDNSYNEYSDSLLIGNLLTSLFKFANESNIDEILEIAELIFRSDYIFKSARNLHSIAAVNLYSILYLRGLINIDLAGILQLLNSNNLNSMRMAALDLLFILSKDCEKAMGYVHSILGGNEWSMRNRLIDNYIKFFEAGFNQYLLPMKIIEQLNENNSDSYLHGKLRLLEKYYSGDFYIIEDYRRQLENKKMDIESEYEKRHEKDEYKTDMDDLVSILKIKPNHNLICRLRVKGKRTQLRPNKTPAPKKGRKKAKVDSEEETYLSNIISSETDKQQQSTFFKPTPVKRQKKKTMQVKIKRDVGVALLRLKK